MAHKVGAGSTRNGRDSNSKSLGIKYIHLQKIKKGSIIIRQHGKKFKPGINVGLSKDFTLYSLISGTVFYTFNNYIYII